MSYGGRCPPLGAPGGPGLGTECFAGPDGRAGGRAQRFSASRIVGADSRVAPGGQPLALRMADTAAFVRAALREFEVFVPRSQWGEFRISSGPHGPDLSVALVRDAAGGTWCAHRDAAAAWCAAAPTPGTPGARVDARASCRSLGVWRSPRKNAGARVFARAKSGLPGGKPAPSPPSSPTMRTRRWVARCMMRTSAARVIAVAVRRLLRRMCCARLVARALQRLLRRWLALRAVELRRSALRVVVVAAGGTTARGATPELESEDSGLSWEKRAARKAWARKKNGSRLVRCDDSVDLVVGICDDLPPHTEVLPPGQVQPESSTPSENGTVVCSADSVRQVVLSRSRTDDDGVIFLPICPPYDDVGFGPYIDFMLGYADIEGYAPDTTLYGKCPYSGDVHRYVESDSDCDSSEWMVDEGFIPCDANGDEVFDTQGRYLPSLQATT